MRYNASNSTYLDTMAHNAGVRYEQQRSADFQVYMTRHDHLTRVALEVMLQEKERMRKIHGWAPMWFLLNPISHKTLNPNPLISPPPPPSPHAFTSNHPFSLHRCYSVTAEDNRVVGSDQNVGFRNLNRSPVTRKPTKIRVNHPPYVSPKTVSQVIDVVRTSKDDCRSKLDSMGIKLSTASVFEIFQVLSFERVHGLRFFEWVRDNNWDSYRKADVCSLMIDNCGWLGDYDTMTLLLKKFNDERICLTDKAFGFLPVLDSSKAQAMESIAKVTGILNGVGGSTGNSGIFAMIHMLCAVDCFEMAKFVIEEVAVAEKKLSYYAILVREKCRKGCTDEAYALMAEMRAAGCEPDSKIYNYILGSLCKSEKLSEGLDMLKEMKEMGVDPDLITFEVFISSSCRVGNLELANRILKMLTDTGCSPRLQTYAALVKGYYNAGRKEEAYEFVQDLEVKKIPAVNKMYSLLANLHQREGNVDVAHRIFDEMMEKGLKPDYLRFAKTKNVLRHTGDRQLAQDLQKKFLKFRVE
ncbi:hypothetical protein OSB04_003477 [Centaurea solstitialis]|uniref:Pentatricopeptide repeat-containing protein n=1 Tax=Centaurea solstitialis TaxID=347529 RepID=A0AA38U7F9_9ASTR|nr:hypothetical protein OSB04_003477 [Centaurea solstitialis]